MQRTVWKILIIAFIIGALSIFAVSRMHAPIDIEVVAVVADTSMVDSVITNCAQYRISPARERDVFGKDITWRIDTMWVPDDQIIEAYDFQTAGPHTIELFVQGKKRGNRVIHVTSCPRANVFIPEGIQRGQRREMIDRTPGSVARQWFVNGESHPDEGGSLNFRFLYAREYDIRVVIETVRETYEYTRTIEVKAPGDRSQEFRSPAVTRPIDLVASIGPPLERLPRQEVEPRRTEPHTSPSTYDPRPTRTPRHTEPVRTPVTPPVTSPVTEPVTASIEPLVAEVPEESTDRGDALFGHFSDSDPTFSADTYDWFKGEEECLTYNGDRTTITIRNLKQDACITNLYFAPDRSIRGNKVEVIISNTADTEKAQTLSRTRTVGVARPDQPLSKVYIASKLGCSLKKGQSYTLTVVPIGNTQLGDIDKMNTDCYNDSYDVDFADMIIRGRTKVLKMDVRLR